MNFMGPAWLDFKPYKILSELPCEVLEKILSASLFVSNLFNILYNDKTRGHITIINIEVMYDDKAVCSARWHGVKGLGTELVR